MTKTTVTERLFPESNHSKMDLHFLHPFVESHSSNSNITISIAQPPKLLQKIHMLIARQIKCVFGSHAWWALTPVWLIRGCDSKWISRTKKKKNQNKNGNTKDNGKRKFQISFIFFLFKFIRENIELWNLSQLIKRNMNQKEISWRQEAESINLKVKGGQWPLGWRLPKISWVKEDSGMLSRHNDIKHTVEEWAGMEASTWNLCQAVGFTKLDPPKEGKNFSHPPLQSTICTEYRKVRIRKWQTWRKVYFRHI